MSDRENEMMEILQKMQSQLIFLEKKLDALLQKSQQKPYVRDASAPSTFRPFNRPDRPYQGNNPGYGQNRGPAQRFGTHRGQGPSQGPASYPRKRKPYVGPGKQP